MNKYKYTPIPYPFELRKSDIHGYGLFSQCHIYGGASLPGAITHIKIDKELIRTPIGGLINHSNNPNCSLEIGLITSEVGSDLVIARYNLVIIRDIGTGDEFTLDYNEGFKLLGMNEKLSF